MKKFSVTRIYSDENGESRFEDILIAMNECGRHLIAIRSVGRK